MPPGGYYRPPPDHPQATTVLVMGILGLVLCQVLGPFAWQMGNRVLAEIDASQGHLGGRNNAHVGRILGIVSTVLLITVGVFFIAMIVFQIVVFGVVAVGTIGSQP